MIIVHLAGGLGNQMFQYAFGRARAKLLGVELALELSNRTLRIHNGFELDKIFDIQAKIVTQAEMRAVLGLKRHRATRNLIRGLGLRGLLLSRYIEEPYFRFAPKMLDIPDNAYVVGYWQSEKYFQKIVKTIHSDFFFRQPLSDRNTVLAEQIDRVNAVSLHVRRGDYVNNPKINVAHGVCSLDYFRDAIRHVSSQVERPHFFIFSDDIGWVKDNLRVDVPCQYVNHNQGAESYNDMRLMSLCKHHIIANSSFSWWGAWLNPSVDKIVIAPKHWFANETNTQDLIPDEWLVI